MTLKEYLRSRKYLPRFLRDFHDQKDVFKSVHRWKNRDKNPIKDMYDITWMQAQCYVIDWFLRYMACHGYTLQKCRSKVDFCNLNASLEADKEEDVKVFRQMLSEQKESKDNDTTG
jgi:hypothetical protein